MADNLSLDFDKNVHKAIRNIQMRRNLKFAMENFILKRKDVFPDADEIENLRHIGHSIKQRALSVLPELLEQLEKKCLHNGIKVHWAETTTEANKTVLDIMRSHDATLLVKGKSMVSEEMQLNSFLRDHGIEALETDLGEFIIQLNNEKPSHIIVPAIHKSKEEIAKIFHEKIPGIPYTEDVEKLNSITRKIIRKKFYNAHVGLSGVNFAVAETGTLCLVENEGNGRMCTTIPPVHIALMGLEKVIEKLDDLPVLLRLLTGSATGQLITTYVNMITSPRKPGEKDGPEEVHLIILDNGRSDIYSDPDYRETLYCIRCGTCLNYCPVYTRIGGHAYGFVYPGPIGKILNPQLEGFEKSGVLTTASSLCLACDEVCPVKIPITVILRRLRNIYQKKRPRNTIAEKFDKWIECCAWKFWVLINKQPLFLELSKRIMRIPGSRIPRIGAIKHWTTCRSTPVISKKSLHELVKEKGIENE